MHWDEVIDWSQFESSQGLVEVYPTVNFRGPMGLVEVRASWPGHPQLSKKEKKRGTKLGWLQLV